MSKPKSTAESGALAIVKRAPKISHAPIEVHLEEFDASLKGEVFVYRYPSPADSYQAGEEVEDLNNLNADFTPQMCVHIGILARTHLSPSLPDMPASLFYARMANQDDDDELSNPELYAFLTKKLFNHVPQLKDMEAAVDEQKKS